jgi:prevent-host-death family protein
MSTVGVRELKNSLTRYLRRTKQGEEVIVTERGNPIALIQPIKRADKAVSLEAKLARLAAEGLVTLPTQKPSNGSDWSGSRVNRSQRPSWKIAGDLPRHERTH